MAFLLALHPQVVAAQGAPKPAPQTKAPAKPTAPQTKAPAKPAAPKPAPAVAAAPVRPAAPPSPQDLRFKTTYTTGDQKTESVTYMKGERERFEFADMVLIKQHDQKRTAQISRAANTYLLVPDGALATAMPIAPTAAATPPKTAGIVMVTTAVMDTGERKPAFGREARHVKTTMDRQPMPGACDQTKQHMETDGWYIDVPTSLTASMKTGIGLAKFAGSMYVNMLTGRTMMNALNSMTTGNLSGMGMLGNPALMSAQARGLGIGGIGGIGKGVDPTAMAASFLTQQAMVSEMVAAGGASGQTGPSFDASLDEALGDAAKAVVESVKKGETPKKK